LGWQKPPLATYALHCSTVAKLQVWLPP
jgi:hypothetical protein